MLKRGQMTIFVILGIVALFMFSIMYFILSGTERAKTEKIAETRERLQGQVKAVEGYVTSCLVRTAGNALLKLGRQGGLRFPCETKCCLKGDCQAACCAKDDAGNDVAYGQLRPSGSAGPYKSEPPLYPFDLGRFAYPWLASGGIVQRISTPLFLGVPKLLPRDRPARNSIQEQLEDEVAATLPQCLNLRTAFPALTITTGQPNVSVAFGNATHASTATNFMLTFPVTISSEAAGAVQTRNLYVYKAPFAFDKIYEDASHIIQEDIKDVEYYPTSPAAVQKRPGRPDDIIRLDTEEELNNEKFFLQFARENRRPALECVEINRDCNDDSEIQYRINLFRQSGSGQVFFNMFLINKTRNTSSLVIIPKDCEGIDGFRTGILGAHASSSHKFVIPGIPFTGKVNLALVDDSINVNLNGGAAYSSGPCVDYDVDTSHPKCTKKCLVLKPNTDVLQFLKQGNNTMDIALCTAEGTPDGFAEVNYVYRMPLAAQDADEDDRKDDYQLVFELQDDNGEKLGNGAAYSPRPGEVTGEFTFHLAVYDEDPESVDWQVVTLPVIDCGGGVVGGAPNPCANGRKDGQESDIDCGGTCPRCVAEQACDENGDCKDGPCDDSTKKCGGTPRCDDNFKNGDETDKDCGGSCPKCGLGKKCSVQADCVTATQCINNVCSPPAPAACLNGVQDSGESDVDCGGVCQKCTSGKNCNSNSDCSSDICTAGSCAVPPPDCTNGVKDGPPSGDETDVDCGGNTCPECADGQACIDPGGDDCQSNKCENFVCISCTDNIMNGDETDQDCGGSCAQCADGKSCSGSSDCQSGNCESGTCAP